MKVEQHIFQAPHEEVGLRALNNIYQRMQIDTEWSVRGERSFSWWAKDFVQHISVTEPVKSGDFWVSRLIAVTPIVEGVEVTEDAYHLLNVPNAYFGTLSAMVLGQDGVVRHVAATTVHEQTLEFVSHFFSFIAAMQVTDAHIKAPFFAEMLKGRQALSAHPTSGPRLDYGHDCLDIIEHLIVPQGKEPSAWTGSDMLDTLALLERYSMMATGDEKGLVAEFPYHGSASLLTFDTDRVHPQVGYGLHVSLKVPDNVFPRSASVAAGLLNQMEAVPELPTKFYGTWCTEPNGNLTFSAFYPNALFHPGKGKNIALAMASRAEWVACLTDKRNRAARWKTARSSIQAIVDGATNEHARGKGSFDEDHSHSKQQLWIN